MSTQFLITGMFRSGTTMLARMLHANDNIICASDPFAPLFKSFRNAVASKSEFDIDPNAPFHDYYFDEKQNRLFSQLQKSDFNFTFNSDETRSLQELVCVHCEPYSPLIRGYLKQLRGDTYAELFQNGIKILKCAYPKQDNKAVGFKEVWVDEFSPHFLGLAEDTRVIHLVRDPRSVVASNFASGEEYPLLFLARQWRKLASLAWHYSSTTPRTKLVYFEDLIQSPEATARDICEFLGVGFDQNMINNKNFKDGSGKQWKQNTSFNTGKFVNDNAGFDSTTIDKWRQTLSSDAVEVIEQLCFFEMGLLGYIPASGFGEKANSKMNEKFNRDMSSIAEWIKPYANYNIAKEMSLEQKRYDDITLKKTIPEQTKRLYAIHKDIFKTIVEDGVLLN